MLLYSKFNVDRYIFLEFGLSSKNLFPGHTCPADRMHHAKKAKTTAWEAAPADSAPANGNSIAEFPVVCTIRQS